MIGHTRGNKFKPSGHGGGSKPGKPQSTIPLIFKVVVSAIEDRAAGSHEARLASRESLSLVELSNQLEQLLPGWRTEFERCCPGRATAPIKLLHNRAYKGDIYSGTSDRGTEHDPRTRAAVPSESWRRKVPANHPLMKIYDDIRSNRISVVADWKRHLPVVAVVRGDLFS